MNDNELDEFIKELGELLYLADKNTVKVLDANRFRLMKETADRLREILKDDLVGDVQIKLQRMCNLGAVTAELDELCSDSPYLFAELLCAADNLEIYPLVNGNIKLNLTFQSVFKCIE